MNKSIIEFGIAMTPYEAVFIHGNGVIPITKTIQTNGVSHVHAHARAWIKFMRSEDFRSDKDGWRLDALWLDGDRNNNVIPF